MTTSKLLLCLLGICVILVMAACGSPPSPNTTSSPGSPIPFDVFLQNVSQARYSDYAQLPTTKVQNEQGFGEMRDYILKLYAGKVAVKSYMVGGQIFDCILTSNVGISSPSNSVGEAQPPSASASAVCPQGSIPMQRVTLERLVQFPTLSAFLAKSPGGPSLPPIPSPGQTNQ